MEDREKKKTFWQRPEGTTGIIVLIALLVGAGILVANLIAFFTTLPGMVMAGLAFFSAILVLLDPKATNLVGYMYASAMRKITSWFIQLDPIAIMNSYIKDLQGNLGKMKQQIGKLRGQMHKLQEIIHNNKKDIKSNLELASQARQEDKQAQMILKSRKAGRLKESNMRLEDLYHRMEILYKVLTKMYENSEILMEDIKDQVEIKEQERKAIHASNSAMKAARSIIAGSPDKRAMFDQAMEAMTVDISNEVGEMERFMQLSANFMDSIDLQNGIFEEEGIKMMEAWEKESISLLLGEDKSRILADLDDTYILDLNRPYLRPLRPEEQKNQYDSFFDF